MENIEEVYSARHNYEKKFPNKFETDKNELIDFMKEL